MTQFDIGKSAIPQAFRKILVLNKITKEFIIPSPVKCFSMRKAWMTSELLTT